MGACCTKNTNQDSHLNLEANNVDYEQEKIEVKKEMQRLREETTSPGLNSSYISDNESTSDLAFKKIEVERNRKFCHDLVKEINLMRTKPQNYLKKIEYYEQFIRILENNSVIFEYENKVYQMNGTESYEELSSFLDPSQQMSPLEFKDELVISLPTDPSLIQSYDYMANQFVMKKLGLSNKYTNFTFHYDINTRNSELSAFFQLLDDSNVNRQRRRNLLNPYYDSIGVSIGRISNDKYCCYVVLGG